jgi:two-component system chemotaxis response regulator CheB
MPPGFTTNFAQRLDAMCELKVREASDGGAIQAGTVYVAPAGRHMTVLRGSYGGCSARLSASPTDTAHIPSVDVLMCSVAEMFGPRAMGVLLTGMGSDGARGMKAIRDVGGWTVGQNASSCAVYGMPRIAADLGALHRIVPLSQMSVEILAAVWGKHDVLTPRASAHVAR